MEAIKIADNPSINLLVDPDLEDTVNTILEVQVDTEGLFQQISLYSEYELNQAAEIHKLIVFHPPREPTKKIDWLEELDNIAFATADHNPHEETYEDLPLNEIVKRPPKYHVPKEYYSRAKDEYNNLDFEEELLREFEKEEKERENRKSNIQT